MTLPQRQARRAWEPRDRTQRCIPRWYLWGTGGWGRGGLAGGGDSPACGAGCWHCEHRGSPEGPVPSSARSRCPTVLPVPGACSNRGASPLLCASPPLGLWGPGTATHQNPSRPLRCRHWSYGIRAQPRGSGGGPGGLRGEQKRLLRLGQVFGPSPAGPPLPAPAGPQMVWGCRCCLS